MGDRRPGDSFRRLYDCLLCSKLPQNSEALHSTHGSSHVSVGQASGHSSPGTSLRGSHRAASTVSLQPSSRKGTWGTRQPSVTQSSVAHDGDMEETRSCPQVPPVSPGVPGPWVFTAHRLSAPACGPRGAQTHGEGAGSPQTRHQEASQRRGLGPGPGDEPHQTPRHRSCTVARPGPPFPSLLGLRTYRREGWWHTPQPTRHRGTAAAGTAAPGSAAVSPGRETRAACHVLPGPVGSTDSARESCPPPSGWHR